MMSTADGDKEPFISSDFKKNIVPSDIENRKDNIDSK